jgi:hypothetical protein
MVRETVDNHFDVLSETLDALFEGGLVIDFAIE